MITSDKFEFFHAQRRKLELIDWRPLMNAQSEKRVRLDFLLPLTGQPLLGLPNFIGPAYESMEREGSTISEADIDVELEGVTVELFSTDSAQYPIEVNDYRVVFTAATLRKFQVVRVTREKADLVCLQFSATVKSDDGCVCWARNYHGGTMWGLFTETQPTIPDEPQDGQMKLGDEAKSDGEDIPKARTTKRYPKGGKAADCPASDGHGGICQLSEFHEGDHIFSNTPPVDLSIADKPKRGKRQTAGVN